MKLCRYWRPESGPSIGIIDGSLLFDLSSVDPAEFGSYSRLLDMDDLPGRIGQVSELAKSNRPLQWRDVDVAPKAGSCHVLAPITKQEVWAAGVTYLRSRKARVEEAQDGGTCYDRVYNAQRPELFFKATPNRVAGPNEPIRIRRDSGWNVPEPELALVVNSRGRLVGYTIGNDVSSRDIEGQNPLYLPQAKVYFRSCSLGPALLLVDPATDPRQMQIQLRILRDRKTIFDGCTSVGQIKRSFDELIEFLFREQQFPHGAILLTGTGIVPPDTFTLERHDVVEIEITGIGLLSNTVE